MTDPQSAIRQPEQERSRRTLEQMVDAAAELLAERPFDEVRVDEIARRAGYTKGAFYHRFEDKEALLRHLNGRTFEEALRGWDEFLSPASWEGRPLSEIAEALVHRIVRIYTERRALMRAFVYQARWHDDEQVRERARELNDFVRERVLALVRTRRSQLAVGHREEPEDAVDFWLAACQGMLGELLLFTDWSGPGVSDRDVARVRRAATDLLVPYLVDGDHR